MSNRQKPNCSNLCLICYNMSCSHRTEQPRVSKEDAEKEAKELRDKLKSIETSKDGDKLKAIARKHNKTLFDKIQLKKILKRHGIDMNNPLMVAVVLQMVAEYKQNQNKYDSL